MGMIPAATKSSTRMWTRVIMSWNCVRRAGHASKCMSCVRAVGELQAQRVLAGREFEGGGQLAFAVVEMLLVGGDDLARGHEIGIDQDVEMSRALVDRAGRLDDQPGCGHHDVQRRRDRRAVGGLGKAHRWRRRALFDDDGDHVLELFTLQGGVRAVGELQAQRVLARREFEGGWSAGLCRSGDAARRWG